MQAAVAPTGGAVRAFLADQFEAGVLWAPVLLASGIGLYFSLSFEPDLPAAGWLALILVPLWLRWRSQSLSFRAVMGACLLFCAGLGVASYRTAHVAAPVLQGSFHGAVEGRYVQVDKSSSNRTRVLLDQVILHGLEPAQTPKRVRVTVTKPERFADLKPGDRIIHPRFKAK